MNDLISRSELINALHAQFKDGFDEDRWWNSTHVLYAIKNLPSVEPEIIYCKYCRKHNQGINEAPYLTDRCPLILHRGYTKGHEFDYQFCVYAERREEEE